MDVSRLAPFALLCAVVAGGTFAAPTDVTDAPTSFERSPTVVDDCTTITESGRYVIGTDVEDRTADVCIRIAANDVTLEGRGHVVSGGRFRENTTGVLVVDAANVTVRNLTAVRWTFGVRFERAARASVAEVATWRTGNGVTLRSSPGATVTGVRTENGFSGVVLVDADGTVVHDSAASAHSEEGVLVAESHAVTLRNCTVTDSAVGVALAGTSASSLRDSTLRANRVGVLLVDSRGNDLRNLELSNDADLRLVNASRNRLPANETEAGRWRTSSRSAAQRLLDDRGVRRLADVERDLVDDLAVVVLPERLGELVR